MYLSLFVFFQNHDITNSRSSWSKAETTSPYVDPQVPRR